MKLYRVLLRGMKSNVTGTNYGSPYVVAEDPASAYQMVKDYVNVRDLGFHQDRELYRIELLAETGDYPECREQLFLPKD